MAPINITKYLQPNEHMIVSADVRTDVRSFNTNAETPVPWADLARPRHNGTVALTEDRLLIAFNPGNVRVVSVPLCNVLTCWERTSEGRRQVANQVVFVLPAGMFCVCELEAPEAEPITALRRIVNELTRMGNLGTRGDSNVPAAHYGDDSGVTAAISAMI
jgi:hypothetical protein